MMERATCCSFILCPFASQMGTPERKLWQLAAAMTKPVFYGGANSEPHCAMCKDMGASTAARKQVMESRFGFSKVKALHLNVELTAYGHL